MTRIDELIRQSCEDIGCDLDSPAGWRTATALRAGYQAGLRDAAEVARYASQQISIARRSEQPTVVKKAVDSVVIETALTIATTIEDLASKEMT